MTALIGAVYALLAPALFAHHTWPFDSDEATHAVEGLEIAADLRHGRLGEMVSHLYFRPWYPPGFSLYLVPFLAVLGPAYWAARYPVLLLSLVNLTLLYQVGRLIGRRWQAGVGTALLGATSPVLWVHASLCMEDALAVTGLLLVAAAAVLAARERLRWLWPGVLAAITFLFRISTGVFLEGALLISCCLQRGGIREKINRAMQVLVPMVVTALLWWGHPYKMRGAVGYFLASSPQAPALTIEVLTHYWGLLGSSYAAGWGIGGLLLASVLLSLPRWRQPEVQFPLALLLVTWTTLALKRQVAIRLFIPGAIAAFTLCGPLIPSLIERGRRTGRSRPHRALLRAALGLTILYLLVATAVRVVTFPFLLEVAYETTPSSGEAWTWTAQHVGPGRIFLINGWDQFSAPTLEWHLASLQWPGWEGRRVVNVDLVDPKEDPEAVAAFQQMVLTSPGSTLVHLENTPVAAAGAWWAYRQALAPCWDGVWEATAGFWLGQWDRRLTQAVLAHPLQFLPGETQASARERFWYPLWMEIHIATCK